MKATLPSHSADKKRLLLSERGQPEDAGVGEAHNGAFLFLVGGRLIGPRLEAQ